MCRKSSLKRGRLYNAPLYLEKNFGRFFPAYLLTVTPGVYEIKLNYAEWNAKESTFNHNKQESIYREGNNANLLADTQNKK